MIERIKLFFCARVLIVLCAAVLVSGCQPSGSAKGLDQASNKVVARVDGAPVYEGEVHRRMLAAFGELDRSKLPPTRWQMMVEAATESEIMEKLLLRAVVAGGMDVPQGDIDNALRKTKEQLGDKNFKKMLKDRKATEEQFRTFLKERELIERYKAKLLGGIVVDAKAVRSYYEGHKKDFAAVDSARIEVIMAANREEAEELHRKWSAGATFDALAREAGTIDGQPAARRLRFTPYDAMPAAIGPKVKEAAKGAILPPAESGGKFYVVRVLEKRPGGPMTFEQAKDEVRQALLVKKQQEVLEQWYEDEAKKVKIEYVR